MFAVADSGDQSGLFKSPTAIRVEFALQFAIFVAVAATFAVRGDGEETGGGQDPVLGPDLPCAQWGIRGICAHPALSGLREALWPDRPPTSSWRQAPGNLFLGTAGQPHQIVEDNGAQVGDLVADELAALGPQEREIRIVAEGHPASLVDPVQ